MTLDYYVTATTLPTLKNDAEFFILHPKIDFF